MSLVMRDSPLGLDLFSSACFTPYVLDLHFRIPIGDLEGDSI